jgi:hypothetical protein
VSSETERMWKELALILSDIWLCALIRASASFFTKRNWPKNNRKDCFALRVPTKACILSDRKRYCSSVWLQSLGSHWKSPVRIAGLWAQVWNRYLPNACMQYTCNVCVCMCVHVRTYVQYCGACRLLPWPRDITSNIGQADAWALAFICRASLSEQRFYPSHVAALWPSPRASVSDSGPWVFCNMTE